MKYSGIKKTLVAVLMAVVSLQGGVWGQNYQVSGSVSDAETGEAMPFVNVALMRQSDTVFMRGATSDMNGAFVIGSVDSGSYLMQVSFVGYLPILNNVHVSGDVDGLVLKMRRGTTLEAVEITAEKPLYVMDGEKNMYNTKEDASIQTGTASDALQNAPGVEVDAEGNITLRGVSSVEIWINDQPSHMNEEALKQYIKTLPANAIERIEVITNPSARYSTNGGVINIVTNQAVKRNELLCVGVRANTMPSVSPWVSYVWANEKVDFNVYLNGSYSQHNMESASGSTLLTDGGDTILYMGDTSKTRSSNIGGYMGFNMNWKIDSMTNLAAWMGGYPYWSRNSTTGTYDYRRRLPMVSDYGYADTGASRGFGGGGYGGLWLEHRFDTTGRKLTLRLNGNVWGNDGTDDQRRDYSLATLTDFRRRSTSRYFGPGATLGVDYVQPLKHNMEMELGAELGYSYNSNDQGLDSLNADGSTWDVMHLRGYNAVGTGWQPQAYVTLQKRWGMFTAKIGLRGESRFQHGTIHHTDMNDGMSLDTALFGLVPSIHLSYRTKTFANFSLSYTLRHSDPTDLLDLQTFRLYDEYSFRTGNPALRRTYTHNFEAAASQYVPSFGMVSLNAYVRANTQEQGSVPSVGTDPYYIPFLGTDTVNYTYPVNIGYSHTEGFEANIAYRPTGFFNVRLNASVFNYGFDYQGDVRNRWSWSARLNVWAKVWNRLEIFANAHYSSPKLGLYSLSVPNKGVDFGLSSDFFNRQLSVYLNVNDIFGMAEWGTNYDAPQYQTTGSQRFDSRFVSLGLTWRIGKMELESKARQGASEGAGMPQM